MKPIFQFNETNQHRASSARAASSRSLRTDYHFQARSFSGYCDGHSQPSFRCISDDYFRREARRHFASEAAFFALIVLTVAVPVAESIYALAQLVYSNL